MKKILLIFVLTTISLLTFAQRGVFVTNLPEIGSSTVNYDSLRNAINRTNTLVTILSIKMDSLKAAQNRTTAWSTLLEKKVDTTYRLQFGLNGGVFVNDANVHNGQFNGIQVIADAILATVTADLASPLTGTITGITLPAGMWIPIQCTTVTLTSGKVYLPLRIK